ncbi:MAG: hypothetical protein A3E83_04500 [Gammaproteobacteria bacterium RIFCSPHIGHO2_12_FULL_41_20]|nr:MAG: hypothetical protein A3E83_04500 [Gammaproteobacteria bacterium RIFCSPHIGHO2_12_FULL_41_20]
MKTRKPITSDITFLTHFNREFNVDRFNVHAIDDESKVRLKKVEDLLNSISEDDISPIGLLKSVYKKIAIYYLFNERNKEAALKYLKKYQSLIPENTVDYAHICTLMGYANTIDPTFRDDTLFLEALSIYPENANDPEVMQYRAFALQYIGLIFHRKAIECDKTNRLDNARENTKKALTYIRQAVDIQRTCLLTFSLIRIGLAESLHIEGVMLIRCGETSNAACFEEANQKLEEAALLEKAFCEETKATHFLVATTLQSLAKVLMYLGKQDEAIDKLNEAYHLQIKLLNTSVHQDIAKTLHFKGDVYVNKKAYLKAVDAYMETWLVRKKISYRDAFMVDLTQKALLKALQELEKENLQLALAKYREIYVRVKEENNASEFAKTIFDKIEKLRLLTSDVLLFNASTTEEDKVQKVQGQVATNDLTYYP